MTYITSATPESLQLRGANNIMVEEHVMNLTSSFVRTKSRKALRKKLSSTSNGNEAFNVEVMVIEIILVLK